MEENLINQLAIIQAKQDVCLYLTRLLVEFHAGRDVERAKIENLVGYLAAVYENDLRDAEGLERLPVPDAPDDLEAWPEILQKHSDE